MNAKADAALTQLYLWFLAGFGAALGWQTGQWVWTKLSS